MLKKHSLIIRRIGIDTYKEPIIYMHENCHVCRSESLKTQARVRVTLDDRSIIATLHTVKSNIIHEGVAGLSEYAWKLLDAKEGDEVAVTHANPLESFSNVRSKIYGNVLSQNEIRQIIKDIVSGRYSDIHIASFLTACAGGHLDYDEVVDLTKAMVEVGKKIDWGKKIVVDKHCVGGLPANRTTPIVVAIVTAFGLTMPKTSSRAITSPAGTADSMEVFTKVDLDFDEMQKVVAKENGCLLWGGSVSFSPADDILIRVERALDIDSEGQMVASVLSKKIAAGSTHVLIDIPTGATSKVRSPEQGALLQSYLEYVGNKLGIVVKVLFTNGNQPVGRGIGPALEARDILQVLKNDKNAPQDLRKKAILLAGNILEFSDEVKKGEGEKLATEILNSGKALEKFYAICKAQGSLKEIPQAAVTHDILAESDGIIDAFNNRQISKIAKLTGAPESKVGGVDLHVKLGDFVKKGDKLYTIHVESEGLLDYALNYLESYNHVIKIK